MHPHAGACHVELYPAALKFPHKPCAETASNVGKDLGKGITTLPLIWVASDKRRDPVQVSSDTSAVNSDVKALSVGQFPEGVCPRVENLSGSRINTEPAQAQ